MSNRRQVILVTVLKPRIESRIWAEADCTGRVIALLECASNVDLGPVAPVVVEPADCLPVVSRRPSAQVCRPKSSNLSECGQAVWKTTKSAESRTGAKRILYIAHCENLPVDRIGKLEVVEVGLGIRGRGCDQLWSRNKTYRVSTAANACPLGAAEEEEFVLDRSTTD